MAPAKPQPRCKEKGSRGGQSSTVEFVFVLVEFLTLEVELVSEGCGSDCAAEGIVDTYPLINTDAITGDAESNLNAINIGTLTGTAPSSGEEENAP